MTQINLLPWREQARKARQMRFYQTLGAVVFLAIMIIFIIHISYKRALSHQQQRISYLQTEISNEQTEVNKLDDTMKQKLALDAEIQFIIVLKKTSYDAVRLFDELAKITPDAVEFKRVVRTNKEVLVIGRAASDSQITLLMKNIRQSSFFEQPVLTEITTKGTSVGDEKMFQLKFNLFK